MHNERVKKPKFAIASATIMAAMWFTTTAISITTTAESVFAYRNNQATSTSNSCLNPLFDSSTFDTANTIGNCGNTVSQQEEAGQASSPITHQTASPTIGEQPPSAAEPQTCEECFTGVLTAGEITELEEHVAAIPLLCVLLEGETPEQQLFALEQLADILQQIGIDQPRIDEILSCLVRVLGL
jgi:hypothetical protein